MWLTVTDPLHVAPWGVFVTTPKVTPQEATVHVRTTLRNDGGQQRAVTLESRLLDPHGKSVASIAAQRSIEPAATLIVDQDLAAPRPALWSPDSPALYRVASSLAATGKDLDAVDDHLRHPHHRGRRGKGAADQRPVDQAAGRLRASRQRLPGLGVRSTGPSSAAWNC